MRKHLMVSVVAILVIIAIAGPGLHDLLGLGHRELHGSASNSLAMEASHGSAEDCPVCQFLIQAQLLVPARRELSASLAPDSLMTAPVPAAPMQAARDARQRAPPISN